MKKDHFLAIGLSIISFALILIHFLFFKHTFPDLNIDEASFFSPAYNLAEKGRLSTDVHSSFLPGSSMYTYWMPPVYMLTLGVIFKITGSTVFIAKLVNLLYMLIASVLLAAVASDTRAKLWIVGITLICPFVILSSTFIRMEALAFLIVSIAILCVKNKAHSAYLGIIAALGVMTHPLLLACGAALALVTLQRGFKPLVYFSIAFLVVLSPYLYYISLDFQIFQDQMALQLIRKAQRKFTESKTMYLIQCVPIALVAMFLLYKTNVSREIKWFFYSGLTLSLVIIIKSLEFNYHIYVIPYIIGIVALYLQQYGNTIYGKYLVPLGFYGFFALLLAAKFYLSKTNTDRYYQEILQVIENDRSWEGKKIYVYGVPDVATFLIENNQDVERQNAVANLKRKGWSKKFNYVFYVKDNRHPKVIKDEAPWLSWKNQSSYTSTNGHYTLYTFRKEATSSPVTVRPADNILQSYNNE